MIRNCYHGKPRVASGSFERPPLQPTLRLIPRNAFYTACKLLPISITTCDLRNTFKNSNYLDKTDKQAAWDKPAHCPHFPRFSRLPIPAEESMERRPWNLPLSKPLYKTNANREALVAESQRSKLSSNEFNRLSSNTNSPQAS